MNKKLRTFISLVLLALAISIGVNYLLGHRHLLSQLSHTPWQVSAEVFGLYICLFGALLVILSATLKICRLTLSVRENVILNAHTLLINFFMPGQGGPAYRGIYLNRKYRLRVKNYVVVTLLYYVIYGIISVLLLLAGSRPWWQTIPTVMVAAAGGIVAFKLYSKRFKVGPDALHFTPQTIIYLCLATGLQALIQGIIYGVELHSVAHHITLSQVITYTGTANLALFVALTPGAIGIRESFLIFTQRLHHISSGTIILANVIDRSVYLAFLLVMAAVVLGLHAHGKFHLTKLPEPAKEEQNA